MHGPNIYALNSLEQQDLRYAVAIFSSRETPQTLKKCLRASIRALGANPSIIDLIINGNSDLSENLCLVLKDWQTSSRVPQNVTIRLWNKPAADKASAWNSYIHDIWPGTPVNFFLDGYVFPYPTTFEKMSEVLQSNEIHHAVSAVPTHGRSAATLRKQMTKTSGLHGNCHLLRGSVISEFRALGFRLPKGLYRVDSLIASTLKFNLDPSRFKWNDSHIAVCFDASWDVEQNQKLMQLLLSHVKRRLRQARGLVETTAIRQIFSKYRRPLSDIPGDRWTLIREWALKNPWEKWSLLKTDPFTFKTILTAQNTSQPEVDFDALTLTFTLNPRELVQNDISANKLQAVARYNLA